MPTLFSYRIKSGLCLSLPWMLALLAITTPSYSQQISWTGATDSDWAKGSNFLGGVPAAALNSLLVGVDTPVTNATIDLGGATTVELYGETPGQPGGNGFNDPTYGTPRVAAFHFGSQGGINEYTVQNGMVTIANGDGMVWIDDGITVNWNVGSVGTQRFYQVGGGSTLNIGTEASTNNRFVLFNGSANGGADEVATVNLNAENYAADQIWLIGSGNSTTVSTTRALRDLILNVNANQTLSGQIHVGYTFLPRQSKIIIRNGAQVTLSGSLTVGESSISSIDPAHATVQVGDESTTGYLELTNELRLGGGAWTFAKGAVGILDIVNGTTFLNRAGTVELGHGHAANGPLPESKGVINIGANGVLITRSNFAERVGTDAGTGVLNFAGGMLVVDDGSRAEQMSNLIDAGVEVNIMDGGMVLQISPAIAATNSGNFNGDETVDAADYTVWRDNLGGDEAVLPVGSGDGSGTIDAGDYDIWKTAFGKPVDPGVVGSATINAPLLGAGAGGLTVQGGGELILTGANTYVGDTVVDASSLSISSPYLADAADVALLGGAILDLAFADTDTIDQLLFDGAPQAAGTWGAIGSGATHEDSRFTGSGLLMVSTSGAGGGSLGSAVPEPGTAIGAVLMFGTLLGFGRPSHSQTKYFVSSSRPSAKSHSLN